MVSHPSEQYLFLLMVLVETTLGLVERFWFRKVKGI